MTIKTGEDIFVVGRCFRDPNHPIVGEAVERTLKLVWQGESLQRLHRQQHRSQPSLNRANADEGLPEPILISTEWPPKYRAAGKRWHEHHEMIWDIWIAIERPSRNPSAKRKAPLVKFAWWELITNHRKYDDKGIVERIADDGSWVKFRGRRKPFRKTSLNPLISVLKKRMKFYE